MRRILLPAVCVAMFALVSAYSFLHVGSWLVVEDPLERAQATFVLGGDPPFRAIQAAAIYRAGWAPEVWLARDARLKRDRAFAKLGIEYPGEREYNRAVLMRLGVPESAIVTLETEVRDTLDEVNAAVDYLQRSGGTTLIIATSQYHTRRVRLLWRKVARPHQKLIVRAAHDNGFRPTRWWRNTSDILAVSREVMGIWNAWLGFPVRTAMN
jgi:uncharacterized SAM-binding protein YcdF (DUF218 family)